MSQKTVGPFLREIPGPARPSRRPSASSRHTGSDGLRVLALLGVAAFHIRPDFVPGGFLGVVIFLTLAGYYTTRSFLRQPSFKLLPYYGRKLMKLWPPLLFMLVLVGVFSALVLPTAFAYYQVSLPSAALGWHNIAEIWRERSYFDRSGFFDPLTHLWALSLEWQYYLAFPLLYMLLVKIVKKLPGQLRPYGRTFSGGVLLVLGLFSAAYMAGAYQAGGDPTPYYYNSFMRAQAFLNGAGICLVTSSRKVGRAGRQSQTRPYSGLSLAFRTTLVWLSFLLILLSYFIWNYQSVFLYKGGFYLYSLLACLYISLGGAKPVPGFAFMEMRPWRYLAERSYSIYLWQYALMVLLDVALRFSRLTFFPRLCIQLILVWALSELTYQLFRRYDTLPFNLKCAFTSLLALLLIYLYLLPLPVEAGPAKLEQEALEDAIRANTAIQESLAAARKSDSPPIQQSSAPGVSDEIGSDNTLPQVPQESIGPTLPAGFKPQVNFQPPSDFLDQSAAWASLANPFGYAESAVQTLADLNLVMIGDSVTALALPSLRTYMPRMYVDAAAARKFPEGLPLIEALDQSGARADLLVVALSSNGWVEETVIDAYVNLAAGRPLLFVNTVVPFVWEPSNNQLLAQAAEKYDNVYVVDWYGAVKGRADYFYEDAFHPLPPAAEIYDSLLLDQVLKALSSGHYRLNPPVDFPAAPPVIYPIIGQSPEASEETSEETANSQPDD